MIIEKDSEGYLVASVPELPGCHTQAKSKDTVLKRIHEAISLYIDYAYEHVEGFTRSFRL